MENMKKMVLVEPELIKKLNTKNSSENSLTHLDIEMKNILNDNELDDRQKWILYLQVLQRYLYFTGEERHPIQLQIIAESTKEKYNRQSLEHKLSDKRGDIPFTQSSSLPKDSKIEESDAHKDLPSNIFYSKQHLLKLIPKSYLKKGASLLELMIENKNEIDWNVHNGLVKIDNKPIPQTNIVDLFNDVLRPLKHSEPVGWQEFASKLKDIKTPLAYIGNPKRFEFINDLYIKDFRANTSTEYIDKQTSDHNITPKLRKFSSKSPQKLIEWEKWSPY